MTKDEIFEVLQDCVQETRVLDKDKVKLESYLYELQFDELDDCDFLVKVEDAFNINIPLEDFEKLEDKMLLDWCNYIYDKQ